MSEQSRITVDADPNKHHLLSQEVKKLIKSKFLRAAGFTGYLHPLHALGGVVGDVDVDADGLTVVVQLERNRDLAVCVCVCV